MAAAKRAIDGQLVRHPGGCNSAAIFAVHAEGDAPFVQMGQSYPAGFVDVAIKYWEELTGEQE